MRCTCRTYSACFKQPGRHGAAYPPLNMGTRLLLLTLTSLAQGGQPMITDDARIADPHTCQLEGWAVKTRNDTQYWVMPICNFTGNLELSMGMARTRQNSETHTTQQVFQAKTLLKPLETNGWGIGFSTGVTRYPQVHTANQEWFANVPLSLSFNDDRFVLHTNLGWLREHETRRHRLTWGIGTETEITKKTSFIAETFGQNQGSPFYQVGIVYWLIPDRVQIDTTYGDRFARNSEQRWFSFGLHFFSASFL